jgi:agmatinase
MSPRPGATRLRPADVPRIYGDVPAFMGLAAVAPGAPVPPCDAAVIGMPFDGIATFRGGATRRAPQEVRRYSLLFHGYSLDWDLNALDVIGAVDAGDVDVLPGDTAASFARFEARLAAIQGTGAVPLMIGGDHAVTFPAVRAVAAHHGGPMGFLCFDTHLDLSEELDGDRLTRASPTIRIAELAEIDPARIAIVGAKGPRNRQDWLGIAARLGIRVHPIAEVERRGLDAVLADALATVTGGTGGRFYTSVDIDAVDPAFAPGTNSPEPGGLSSREIIRGLRVAMLDPGCVGMDVVEISPDFDAASGITSMLGARLVVEAMLCLAARRRGVTSPP